MDLIASYGGDSDSDSPSSNFSIKTLDVAPVVSGIYDTNTRLASVGALRAFGPIIPAGSRTNSHIEPVHINDYSFQEQFHMHGRTPGRKRKRGKKRKRDEEAEAKEKAAEEEDEEVQDEEEEEQEEEEEGKGKAGDEEGTEEQKEEEEKKKKQDLPGETTTIHGTPPAGWINPPGHMKPKENAKAFLPKKSIHTWSGHTKGVNCIQFFPKSGHLILSAGLDGKVKIWDVVKSTYRRQCIQTYWGHEKGLRDVRFSDDGLEFISAGFDRVAKIWDTETGQCKGVYTNRKVPYVVRYYPKNNKQFLMGCSNNHIVQWDTRSNKIVQKYDRHMGTVNTITFVEGGRRFVSSSDDKSLRVWDYGINVEIKIISEPHMFSMPSIELSPDGAWLACQSMDNQILIYGTKDRFRMNRKKRFRGHTAAGFACKLGFSPDGRYLISGDGDGRLFMWDWKSTKIYRTLRCHKGPCIGVAWHPVNPSWVATCGWDGLIHLWD